MQRNGSDHPVGPWSCSRRKPVDEASFVLTGELAVARTGPCHELLADRSEDFLGTFSVRPSPQRVRLYSQLLDSRIGLPLEENPRMSDCERCLIHGDTSV